MQKQIIIKVIWIIYLLTAVVFLINAMSKMTGYFIFTDVSVETSAVFAFIFIAATVLLVLYNRKLRRKN